MQTFTVTIGDEGEITLPPEICERLGVGEGDEVDFVLDDEGVHLRAAKQEDKPFVSGLETFKNAPRDDDFEAERIQDTPPDPDL